MKKIFIILLLASLLLVFSATAQTWDNNSYENRYPYNITYNENFATINNTLVKLDVSTLTGYLPSLKVYDETGLELKWQWYVQSTYNTSGDYVHYNQTILVLGNFTNTVEKTVYVYTPNAYINDESSLLIGFLYDFEGTNHSIQTINNGTVPVIAVSNGTSEVDGGNELQIIDDDASTITQHRLETPNLPDYDNLERICFYVNGSSEGTTATRAFVMTHPGASNSVFLLLDRDDAHNIEHYDGSYNDWGVVYIDTAYNYVCYSDINQTNGRFDGNFEGELVGDQFIMRPGQHGNTAQISFGIDYQPIGTTFSLDRMWGTSGVEVENFYKDPAIVLGALEEIQPSLTINTDLVNNSYVTVSPFTINYNGTAVGDSVYNCTLLIDTVANQTDNDVDLTVNQDFSVDFGIIEQSYGIEISCENSGANDATGVYTVNVDTSFPRIAECSPTFTNNSQYELIANEDVDTCFNFTNENLQNYSIVFNNGTTDVETIFADVVGLNLTFAENISTRTATALGGVGNYTIDVLAYDVGDSRQLIWNFEVLACSEDWQPYYTSCTIGDNQTLYYLDNKSCGTFDDLPGDNGTVTSCNYCTLIEHPEETACMPSRTRITYYVYDNFGTCCNVTGLSSDCTLTSNSSSACAGVYSSGDLTGITVDTIAEGGIIFKDWIPLLVVILSAIYILAFPTILGKLLQLGERLK